MRFTIRVIPNASRNQIVGWIEEGVLKVKLTAPATDGKANKYLIEFLAKEIGVSKSAVTIVRGETSRHKTIQVNGLKDSCFFEGFDEVN
ncbi:YggU family protein [bacterium]|jgi:uncharacterized protein|nr:YggU family protein [bacterium]